MIALIRKFERFLVEKPARSATILAWVSQGLSILANLAIVPLVLHRVGSSSGIWFFLLTWTGMFTILDFGFSQSISRQITFSLGQKGFLPNSPKGRFIRVGGSRVIGRTISASKTLFRIVSVIILLYGVFAERTFLFSGRMESGLNAHVCWYLIIAASIILNENRVYSTALTGMLFIAQARLIGLFQILLQNALIILFLFLSPRIEMMGAAILLGSFFAHWRYRALWESRKPPGVHIGRPKWTIVASLWRASWQNGVASASAYFIFAVNPIVIGYLLGPDAVTIYYLPLRIGTILFSSIADIIAPQINFMIALYRNDDIRALLVRFFRIFIVVSLASFVLDFTFAVLGPWGIHIWSIGKVTAPAAVFWFMSLYYFLAMIQTLFASFIIAHGMQPFAKIAVMGAVLNLLFLFAFIPWLGLAGATIATFASQLLTCNWFVAWYAIRFLRDHFQKVPFREVLSDAVASLKKDLHLA